MNIIFLCLARNCEATLPIFFSYLRALEGCGLHSVAIIGENGSKDKTRLLIEEAGPPIALLDTKVMELGTSRLMRMAIGRQTLLEAGKARGASEDYVCVADLDNVMLDPPSPESLISAIERLRADNALFAVGASSRPVYYDLLSLRAEGHDYSTLNKQIAVAKTHIRSYFQFHQRHIYSKQRLVTRPHLIPCSSSFNGLCLYNARDYWLGTYRATNEADVCEHVTFNLSLVQATGKQMLIAPEMVVRAPADHIPVSFLRFWFDRIREGLSRSGR